MTSTKIFIENYKAITLEIELLKIRKKFVGVELQTLLFDNNQNKAFELNMELDAIDYTIIELEKLELEFNNTLLAFSSMFNDLDSYIFVKNIIKNEPLENTAKLFDLSVETIIERKKYIEKEIEKCLE